MSREVSSSVDIEVFRAKVLDQIDEAAGEVRRRFISPGFLIDEEYRQAVVAVRRWRDAGSPADAVPAEISTGAAYSDITDEQSAQEIEQSNLMLMAGLQAVRAMRLTGKRAVQMAQSKAEIAQSRTIAFQELSSVVAP